jgi:hypothetical protein
VDSGRKRLWTYLSAGVLVFLTLYVFYRLQDYGPESAIRRFHAAIKNRDPVDLQRVTKQPIDSSNTIKLIGMVQPWLAEGWSYKLLRMDRSPFQVRAAVVYTPPKEEGYERPLIWVVEKSGRAWMVDVDKTVTILNDLNDALGRPPMPQ